MAKPKNPSSGRPRPPGGKNVTIQVLAAPPAERAPQVPDGFHPLTKSEVSRLKKPTQTQVGQAETFAAELERSRNYRTDFGTAAPAPGELATDLRTARAWTLESRRAQAYADYALAQSELLWDNVIGRAEQLQTQYDHAVGNTSALADDYPATGSFLGVRRVAARKGAETRRKNRQKKAG
jgi:hypothetical protein